MYVPGRPCILRIMKIKKTFWYYKNLDCSQKENRVILVKKLCRILDINEKPDKEELRKICKNLSKRLNIHIVNRHRENGMISMICFGNEKEILHITSNSPYELFAKFIITVKMKYEGK